MHWHMKETLTYPHHQGGAGFRALPGLFSGANLAA